MLFCKTRVQHGQIHPLRHQCQTSTGWGCSLLCHLQAWKDVSRVASPPEVPPELKLQPCVWDSCDTARPGGAALALHRIQHSLASGPDQLLKAHAHGAGGCSSLRTTSTGRAFLMLRTWPKATFSLGVSDWP